MKTAIICFPNITWNQVQFPTGIYKIRQYCRNEYDVLILDERLENVDSKIEEILANEDVLCLGLSVMTGEQISSAIRISKKYHKMVPIVWGGVHPTILPRETISSYFVDYIIRGDGEEAFLNLLRFLDMKDIDKQMFLSKDNENFEINYFQDLGKSMIDFSVEKIDERYFIQRDKITRAFSLETSRGCPHNCGFCHNTILGHKYRTVEEKEVINSINVLREIYNINGIVFQEDNFFLNVNRVKKIVGEIKKYKDFAWKANSRISYFYKLANNEKFMNELVESNCHVLQFGIESGSNRILDLIKKKISVEDVVKTNKLLSKYSINLRYNFIIGFPTESSSEIEMTLELIKQLMDDNPNVEPPFVNIYTPYPGTPIYKLAVSEGFLEPKSLEEWSEINWNSSYGWRKDKNVEYRISEISNVYLKNSKYLKG